MVQETEANGSASQTQHVLITSIYSSIFLSNRRAFYQRHAIIDSKYFPKEISRVYKQQQLFPLLSADNDNDILSEASSSRPPHVQRAIDTMAEAEAKERGAVFTRREVVEFILDLIGYTPEKRLFEASLLEPAFGSGDFLLVALGRLLTSYLLHHADTSTIVPTLKKSIVAVELHQETFLSTRTKMVEMLRQYGVLREEALALVTSWLRCDDFLLTPLSHQFTHIIGNPPYLRQELIPDTLLAYYRSLYTTIYDRADLYIPFIERSLSLLTPTGKLSFICPDRWTKNKYGGPLRELVSKCFHLQAYVDMRDTNAFQSEVSAYPAIVYLTPQKNNETYIAHKPSLERSSLERLATSLRNGSISNDLHIHTLTHVVQGNNPWLFGSTDSLTLLRRLEDDFPLLEDHGCKVGIGVATGCDSVYIGLAHELPIENDRKLPLLMASDLHQDGIIWNERYIVNPFDDSGKLINLDHYPLLAEYFYRNEKKIRNRSVAQKKPSTWYRTIDKIYPPLLKQPKLLIPDIKEKPIVVYDEGHYYPHHNLYYVTSTHWDLHALQAVLQSPITLLFISAYSVKMRGGYLRFQAQNIRRIHLPRWEDVPVSLQKRLITSRQARNRDACNEAVFELYQLSQEERNVLHQFYGG